MSNGTGDLIQATLESWESNDWCGAASGEWCVRASVFGWFGQLDGDAGVVKGDDQVRIEYTLQDDQDTWVQYVFHILLGLKLEGRVLMQVLSTGPSRMWELARSSRLTRPSPDLI
jgi:hypothetical protein